MKKISSFILLLVCLFFITSCEKENPVNTVTFMYDDNVYEVVQVLDNSVLVKPEDPYKDLYEFIGWYLNDELIGADYIVTCDVTLVAKFNETGKHVHLFDSDSCSRCGSYYNELLFNLYGDDSVIYTNDMSNPYGIDLDLYGSNVNVLFYTKDTTIEDPYANVSKEDFYANYSVASSYEDALFRTTHGLMSGDITPQGHIPSSSLVTKDGKDVRVSTATYVLDEAGNYIAYVLNNLNGSDSIIYYGGAYTSINEVAAYLLAFGEVPPNNNYNKNTTGRKQSVAFWGEYGRCNTGEFYGNTGSYPYEPSLPNNDTLYYVETDFGTLGGYSNVSPSKRYDQIIYNDGKSISRGSARFCFVSDPKVKSIDERYVFYTYNHYNDFQEFLNYYGGFGTRFGNESAGNVYCSNANDYNNYATNEITNYIASIFVDLKDINA